MVMHYDVPLLNALVVLYRHPGRCASNQDSMLTFHYQKWKLHVAGIRRGRCMPRACSTMSCCSMFSSCTSAFGHCSVSAARLACCMGTLSAVHLCNGCAAFTALKRQLRRPCMASPTQLLRPRHRQACVGVLTFGVCCRKDGRGSAGRGRLGAGASPTKCIPGQAAC